MADKVRAPILIFAVLILVSLFFAAGVFNLLQKERTKNLALNDELEAVKIEQRTTQAKLEDSQKTISALELKLQEAKTQSDSLSAQLEQEKSEKQGALDQIEQLRADLEKQQSIRSDLESKLTEAQKDVKNMQAQLKEVESKRKELETKIKDLEEQVKQTQVQQTQDQGVELGKIVVSPEGTNPEQTIDVVSEGKKAGTPVSGLEGKILVVNKDYNFAVINLGSKDGVDIGNIFSVYENNKYVGDIKVEKVHDSMAAADFSSIDMKDKVKEGDRVVQKTK